MSRWHGYGCLAYCDCPEGFSKSYKTIREAKKAHDAHERQFHAPSPRAIEEE